MPTIDFESVQPGYAVSHSEDGYTIFSQLANLAPEFSAALWSGKSFNNVTAGGYFLNNYSSDILTVRRDGPNETFGAKSIQVDGFDWGPFEGGAARTGTSEVTFTFYATRASDYVTFEWSMTAPTDGLVGFEQIALPREFHAGLIEFGWSVSGGTGWGAFDNLVVTPNSAPVASAFSGTVTGGQAFVGQLLATDADNAGAGDPLQPVTFVTVGDLPEGVYLSDTGELLIEPLEGDGDLATARTISFKFKAFDGAEYSAEKTATITVKPAPMGADIRGGNKPQSLCGTDNSERIFGGNSGDTLCGKGGADTLDGGNGTDSLCGGTGADKLLGGNGEDWLDAGAGSDLLDGGNGNDWMSGGEGNDVLLGENGVDTLAGGAGDDTMTGGNSPDLFVFDVDWGADVIKDFDVKNEVLQFSTTVALSNWGDVLSLIDADLIRQQGKDVMIEDGLGNSLMLVNVKLSALDVDNFAFV
jgi:Ca2+-binding RTX toxin-like protein